MVQESKPHFNPLLDADGDTEDLLFWNHASLQGLTFQRNVQDTHPKFPIFIFLPFPPSYPVRSLPSDMWRDWRIISTFLFINNLFTTQVITILTCLYTCRSILAITTNSFYSFLCQLSTLTVFDRPVWRPISSSNLHAIMMSMAATSRWHIFPVPHWKRTTYVVPGGKTVASTTGSHTLRSCGYLKTWRLFSNKFNRKQWKVG